MFLLEEVKKLENNLNEMGLETILSKVDLSSLEGIVNEAKVSGKAEKEIEYTYWAKLKDLNDLKKASKIERQEQWYMKSVKEGGMIRVRSIDDKQFILTVKKYNGKVNGLPDVTEIENEINKEMYEELKALLPLGIKKIRHVFPIPNSKLKWEIDLSIMPNGEYFEWVKFDLEVPKHLNSIPPLPVDVVELINANEKSASMDNIWSSMAKSLHRNPNSILPVKVTGKE